MFELKLYNDDGKHVSTVRGNYTLRLAMRKARDLLSHNHPCVAVYKDGLWIKEYSL
ncbi:hypothetical protein H7K28_15035 [Paenibacillus polymyxa]|jgi:hypothetical protein|uniref:hypothetical protein n=1 Tax=Paenibacillus polymyxa TaxID=1406 RepID=UPI00157FC0E9|nr:hypothetical protein [Paenibacillus polymyxa]MBY0024523.1 hypothetical protein [Paenibacillus polymyxa]MBY0058651.1 hypothetical protein [Paenibacillus polymyxa]MBY0071237.1 hypothetical protein [Paenibacillus polymyxa]MBY0078607.1 hypothetical protein [Paenibacillus polymyxa]MBZ6441690.1 hypothetical protein [Paenibacillus polymyxa]